MIRVLLTAMGYDIPPIDDAALHMGTFFEVAVHVPFARGQLVNLSSAPSMQIAIFRKCEIGSLNGWVLYELVNHPAPHLVWIIYNRRIRAIPRRVLYPEP